ncbi:MAG: DUF1735 domain-containing protein [Bacteroidales bacterium]|nr:DUF1735 domain-containing protein [Bacteroidales bacterium]
MRRIIALSCTIILTLCFFSCENEKWSFSDFDYTTAYFPYQFPVRTLVLGEYIFDNSRDNEHKFLISANMGGVYQNKETVLVEFVIDNSLTSHLTNFNGGTSILPLPTKYYTLSNNETITIPAGKFFGSVEVQLTEDFLNDSLAIGINYVIPMRIVSASTDSVLQGKSNSSDPDPRIAGEWSVPPKNFTLFGIKFVNEYHGKYLLRGESIVKNADGDAVDTITYHQNYVVHDEVVLVNTASSNAVTYNNSIRLTDGSPGEFEMIMTFDNDGNCTIINTDTYSFEVTGSGKFVKNGDEWGDKKRHVIQINYQINDGTYIHHVSDTLVFRDKNVQFEEFEPLVTDG